MSGMLTRGIEFDADPVALDEAQRAQLTRTLVDLTARRPEVLFALALFGARCLVESRRCMADLDGGWLQQEAELCGLLKREAVTRPCEGDCLCDDFPGECLRYADGVLHAVDALNLEEPW